MKLPIKKKYFDAIKEGNKHFEYRDAHITFICEETGESIKKAVIGVRISQKYKLPHPLDKSSLFTDDRVIVFELV